MSWNRSIVVLALGFANVCVAQQVYRVAESAAPGGDGLAWGSAFDDLQTALAVAVAGDEIWIGQGLYTPSESDASASFVLVDGVSIYGGFVGTETLRSQRDTDASLTVLSGDIGHDDTFNPYLINSANSGHVVVASGVSEDAVIDGLTIEYGAYGPEGGLAGNPLMSGAGSIVLVGRQRSITV